ncbi:MAG: adenine-specific methyltransferase EcoRI family protein [Spirochaetaceae bacterium]|jgi:hypothetical protein|nr:adenine-specific methyltransferase EcoRI family protein [Spirochaetaceae bacterium]
MARSILNKARKEKADEFYTRLSDIERELIHYREYFKGKTILCNCDDPRVSKFFYFFYASFHTLGLKRLITTCYKNLNPDLFSQNLDEQAVYCIYDGTDRANDKYTDYGTFMKQNEWGVLKGDGDFRSPECIELLKQADIVCSNPPFSLLREYVAQLIKYEKEFLIIGNQNAITYKDIFIFIKENKLWLGINPSGMCFNVPEGYTKTAKIVDGVVMGWIGSACWFTNLNHKKRNEYLTLYENYNQKKFPKYDNFDAIEVCKVSEIPKDYGGIMGVPITFLDKYNPEQFEIIGVTNHGDMLGIPFTNNCFAEVKGERKYVRILIKTKRKQNDN